MSNSEGRISGKRIAYIGQRYICYALAPLGVDVFPTTEADAVERLKLLVDSRDFGIIFLSESLYEVCRELMQRVVHLPFPVIVVLPDMAGSRQIALEIMREKMRKAAGRDIVSEGEDSCKTE